MKIDFEPKRHIYLVNGDIASVSVTELLSKHKLSPDYSNVPKSVLNKKSNKGKEIHKDLENVLNLKDYTPTTRQGELFSEYVDKNIDCGVGEQMLAYDYNGMIIAGTADVIAITKSGDYIIADHKTTSSVYRDSVSWQVSILDYMARKVGDESINGKYIKWNKTDKFYCLHYGEDTMDIIELDKIPDSEIERLFECEFNNEIYTKKNLIVEDSIRNELKVVQTALMDFNRQMEQYVERDKQLRETLLNLMKSQGVKSWETDGFKITYIEPVEKIGIDSKKVKEKYPMVFNDCQKLTTTKASIRITIRDNE